MSASWIGKQVDFKMKQYDKEWNDEYRSQWGTVIDFDGEFYHVKMNSYGEDLTGPIWIFTRDEIKVRKSFCGISHINT